jgi:hypothetical protein
MTSYTPAAKSRRTSGRSYDVCRRRRSYAAAAAGPGPYIACFFSNILHIFAFCIFSNIFACIFAYFACIFAYLACIFAYFACIFAY